MDAITNLPQIIMPGEPLIQRAVSKLNNKFPGIFKNVKEIRVSPEGAAIAHVTNDPKSTGVIFLDFYKIKTQVASQIAGTPAANQEDTIINAIAETLSHEIGHLDVGLKGGEFPAEQNARQKMQQLLASCNLFEKLATKHEPMRCEKCGLPFKDCRCFDAPKENKFNKKIEDYNKRKEEAYHFLKRNDGLIADPPEWLTTDNGEKFISFGIYERGNSTYAIRAEDGKHIFLGFSS